MYAPLLNSSLLYASSRLQEQAHLALKQFEQQKDKWAGQTSAHTENRGRRRPGSSLLTVLKAELLVASTTQILSNYGNPPAMVNGKLATMEVYPHYYQFTMIDSMWAGLPAAIGYTQHCSDCERMLVSARYLHPIVQTVNGSTSTHSFLPHIFCTSK